MSAREARQAAFRILSHSEIDATIDTSTRGSQNQSTTLNQACVRSAKKERVATVRGVTVCPIHSWAGGTILSNETRSACRWLVIIRACQSRQHVDVVRSVFQISPLLCPSFSVACFRHWSRIRPHPRCISHTSTFQFRIRPDPGGKHKISMPARIWQILRCRGDRA